jgi:alpha-galactosidase
VGALGTPERVTDRVFHLRGGEVSVVVDATGDRLPRVLHWGAALGEETDLSALVAAITPPVALAKLDVRVPLSLVPERAAGHRGRPGLTGSRAGRDWSPSFRVDALERPDDGRLVVTAREAGADLALQTELQLAPSGVLTLRHTLRNHGPSQYGLEELACVVPVPPVATEVLDLTGRWCRERSPQRHRVGYGTWLRESRHGRTGHDATLMLIAGTPGFRFRTGEVWGVHLAWSGDASTWVERLPDGTAVLGAAELLGPGEVVLDPDDEYETPALHAVWSGRGIDGLSAAMHAWVRARPAHPRRPRPVVLNTWEAVYFDHRIERLAELANTAARLGVERFVLDDGWFGSRRDDTAGLGDWHVSPEVWPEGLRPLVEHVRGLGMEFGLWVEPEMVNLDSELFRAHPDWVMRPSASRLPPPWRHQQVLDLANPGAYAHVRDRLDALLREYDLDYLKWDHNRDLVEAGHEGRPGVHEQTLAAYRLMDELKARHPRLEIESCSSGGARVDLGILARTDRVWPSDTNDALERQAIQRWTQLLVPPELIGTHVGPPRAHTTGRIHDLSFRIATALFGHFGIEWDVTSASPEEQDGLAEAIMLYKQMRDLLHGGKVVRADHPDPAALLHGVVAPDGGEALFAYVQLATSVAEVPGAARIPGLAPDRTYRVAAVPLAGGPALQQAKPPPWQDAGGVTVAGSALGTTGLQMPVLQPEQALVLHLTTS